MSLISPIGKRDHIQGNENALIELVEYGDYQCPYCRQAYHVIKKLQMDYGEQLKFIFRNFPLTNIHRFARLAAIAGEAAARQNKYWQMHDALYETDEELELENILEMGEKLGLNIEKFLEDFTEITQDSTSKVEADMYGGVRSGVAGTPTFFINGEKFNGNWQNSELWSVFDRIIQKG
ncbi:DsbA family protein [Flavobacterium sp. LC2016-01]|uniref:DsbA family protein n=1 Tax=Flavobacterium sp. LC2016-01 TaxID=2675876 RepID=UPI0012BABA01|nr:DsbA family protein [Flavobacterium sp. LC2016-01]MTH17739.1 thioredoxin domain-containing protein [Flavobacterium sp. LC2016-01]